MIIKLDDAIIILIIISDLLISFLVLTAQISFKYISKSLTTVFEYIILKQILFLANVW